MDWPSSQSVSAAVRVRKPLKQYSGDINSKQKGPASGVNPRIATLIARLNIQRPNETKTDHTNLYAVGLANGDVQVRHVIAGGAV
jgi:hypothetical protein